MSLFNDYSYQILHHETERDLLRQVEQRRLAREAGAAAPTSAGGGLLARLFVRATRPAEPTPVGSRPVRPVGHRFAH